MCLYIIFDMLHIKRPCVVPILKSPCLSKQKKTKSTGFSAQFSPTQRYEDAFWWPAGALPGVYIRGMQKLPLLGRDYDSFGGMLQNLVSNHYIIFLREFQMFNLRFLGPLDFKIGFATLSSDQLTLVVYAACCTRGIVLPCYIGIMTSHYEVPIMNQKFMNCQPRVLNVAHLFIWYLGSFEITKCLKSLTGKSLRFCVFLFIELSILLFFETLVGDSVPLNWYINWECNRVFGVIFCGFYHGIFFRIWVHIFLGHFSHPHPKQSQIQA